MERLIRAKQIDFGEAASTAVVSDSLRFVLPVPPLTDGGEALQKPDGAPFADGASVTGRGIVFFDRDDQCWETARGDGSDVILFSPIDAAQADALKRRISALATPPDRLTLEQLKAVIGFAYDTLGIRSAHNATRAYVAAAMAPVAADRFGVGLFRRKASDLCRAVYLAGAGAFVGAGATPQRFADGAVIVRHGKSIRLVQPVTFEMSYRRPDGGPLRIADLAAQTP